MKQYTEKEKTDFLVRAQEVGIGRAIREMKYPTYPTALQWAQARGVKVHVDPIAQRIKMHDANYKAEHILAVIHEGLSRAFESLAETDSLTADDQKKIADAVSKYTTQWLVLNGKASNISETQVKDSVDSEIAALVDQMRQKNALNEVDNATHQ